MNDQKDLDSINDELYSLVIPDEPLKKIMFYFKVLTTVIDLKFPLNYLYYDHPYFKSYYRMEEFLALARTLNPDYLYHNNVIIFHNEKDIYKYYQTNNDPNGIPYEFKVVDLSESFNPIYTNNYKNTFNINNVDPAMSEFTLTVINKVNFPHSEDSIENTSEEHYFVEEDKLDNPFEPDNYDYDRPLVNYNDIHDYYDESEIQKNAEVALQNFAYNNQMNSIDELEEDLEDVNDPSNMANLYVKNVKIINKLVVSKDWIDYIYNEPIKELTFSMKKVIKDEDVIRSKSISLPKNVFFYLEFFMLALLICCSVVLFIYTVSLLTDDRFALYDGKNESGFIFFPLNENPILQQKYSSRFDAKNVFFDGFDTEKSFEFLSSNDDSIDYNNDSFIVPNRKKHKVIFSTCIMSVISSGFGVIYFAFIIYMYVRVSRDFYKKYQSGEMKNEAGLNMCHVVGLIILTVVSVVISLVDEILIIVSFALKTYKFIHDYIRTQFILNSIMFVSYFLIQYFYCLI